MLKNTRIYSITSKIVLTINESIYLEESIKVYLSYHWNGVKKYPVIKIHYNNRHIEGK